jgi:serine/threonine protein kinase
MPQSMHGPGSNVAPADQPGSAGNTHSTDPSGGIEDTEALIRALGVAAGQRLDGRYRLDRVLHPTGPALTWLATDEKLNRPTRVHLLRSDQPRAKAFMEAARAAAAMPDNHFVQVLDAVPDEGLYYVITEWLHDGRTLGEVLAAGPIPVPEAVRITIELARAMAEAHDSGLAHLRLSPKTVLRTDTGEVKILDLCLAAALTGTVSRDPLGTDLSAIGELAYAMLTGKRPGTEPAPPSTLRPDVSPQLDEIVLRTLGDPTAGESYQSPTEVAEALTKLPRPRFEEPLRSTPQTAPLRHAQTQVMAAGQRPPSYEPPPQQRPANRPGVAAYSNSPGGSQGPSHGGGHRPPAERSSYEDYDSGSDARSSKNMKIGVGAVAAVAVVSLLAWQMMSGGKKNNATGTTGGGTTQSQTSGSTPTPVPGAGLKIAGGEAYIGTTPDPPYVSVLKAYDSDPTTGWNSPSYRTSAIFRKGSGIVFDLGSVQTVKQADITLGVAGAHVQMFAADSSVTALPPVKDAVPDGFKLVKELDNAPTTFTLTADAPIQTQYVLVWFTSVPVHPGATGCGAATCYDDSFNEVKFS